MWFAAAMKPPDAGRFSCPRQSRRVIANITGRTMAATTRNGRFAFFGAGTVSDATGSAAAELGAEGPELVGEVLVPAVDDADAADGGLTLRGERRDEVAEAAAQVRHLDLRGRERRRPGDDGGVVEVALTEAAR